MNKIGAYFHLDLPQSTAIERIHFDFADSLLEWGSPCQMERTRSCSVSLDHDDSTVVSPLDPDCGCRSAQINASSCNYHHMLAFLRLPLPLSSDAAPQLKLKQVSMRNMFDHFNSLIGFFSQAPPHLVVEDSLFESISICGPIIGTVG